jgi:polysaccharide biosynthesis/export protein
MRSFNFRKNPGALPGKLGCMILLLLGQVLGVRAFAQTMPRTPASIADLSANLPVQKIGIDDLIGISVYDAPELTRTLRVSSDGTIRLAMLQKRILVAGLFPVDVETAIAEELIKEDIMVDPMVLVSLVESRSRPIRVAGAVKQPVTFEASGMVTLLDALNRAGGLTDSAGPQILVSRTQPGADGKGTTLTQRIAVSGLIAGADSELNVELSGGEQIRVPEAGRVYVVGNVKRPGAFSMRDASETSVLKVLALSEGLVPYAAKEAFIYRREGALGGKNEIPVDLAKIMERKSPDIPLLQDDILYIPDNQGRRKWAAAMEKVLLIGGGLGAAAIVVAH